MKPPLRPLAIAFSFLLIPHAPAFGQSKGADLTGMVRDSSGAVMPRVTSPSDISPRIAPATRPPMTAGATPSPSWRSDGTS
jgi:hypothetical protein